VVTKDSTFILFSYHKKDKGYQEVDEKDFFDVAGETTTLLELNQYKQFLKEK